MVQKHRLDPEECILQLGINMLGEFERRLQRCCHCEAGERCEGQGSWAHHGETIGVADGSLGWVCCEKWQQYAFRKRLQKAGLGRRFLQHTFEAYAPKTEQQKVALESVQEYVETFRGEGNGLILTGPVGTGKTHLACALTIAVAKETKYVAYTRNWETGEPEPARETPYDVLFVAVPAFLARIRASFDDPKSEDRRLMERAAAVDLLVLDDFGVERITDWAREQLYIVVNHRYENLQPTVITTNCSGRELQQRAGERIVSRLHEMCRIVVVDGPDYRRMGKDADAS